MGKKVVSVHSWGPEFDSYSPNKNKWMWQHKPIIMAPKKQEQVDPSGSLDRQARQINEFQVNMRDLSSKTSKQTTVTETGRE